MKKTKAETKTKSKYHVLLDCRGVEFKFHGDTILQCLEQIKPMVIKSTGILSVTKGGRTAKRVLRPMQIKRLWMSKTIRAMMAKQFETMLK